MRGAGMSDLNVNVTANVSNFVHGMSDADKALNGFMGNAEKNMEGTMNFLGAMGSSLTSTFTEPIIGALSDATDAFVDFDQQMRAIEVVTELDGLETMESVMGTVSDKAKEIGKSSLYSAQEAADAMEIMAKAGLNTDAVLGSIDSTMKLAAGSGTDLYLATDTVTTAMRMFGYDLSSTESAMASAAEVSNVLMVAANESAIDVSELANSFRYIGPIAGSMGMSIQDVSVALAALGNNGIRATQAGTTLRRIFQNLLRPTDEQAAMMEKLGISMFDAEGNTKEFAEIMDTLRYILKQGTDEQRAYLTSLIGDTTAMSGLNALVNTSTEDWDRLTDAINNSSGAVDKASDTLMGGLGGSIEKAKGSVESLKLTLMEQLEPALISIADGFASVVQWFEGLDSSTQKAILGIVGFTAALGPMMLAVNAGYKTFTTFKGVMGTLITPQTITHIKNAGVQFSIFAENAKMAALNANKAGMASYFMGGQLKVLGHGFKSLFAAMGPAGWFILGLTAVTTILPKVISLINKENKAHKDNLKAIKEVRKENKAKYEEELNSIKELDGARQDNLNASYVDAQAQANQGKATIDMLNKQMQVENKSTAQKQYINSLVEQLNGQYADLNLKYNEEADTLNKTNGELREYIENVQERAQVAAMEEYLTQLYKDQLAAKQGAAQGEAQMIEYIAAYKEQQSIVASKEAELLNLNSQRVAGIAGAADEYTKVQEELELEKTILGNIKSDYYDIKENTAAWNSELENSTVGIDYTSAAIANANIAGEIDNWIEEAQRAGVDIPENLRETIDNGSAGVIDSTEALANLIVREIGYIPSDIESLGLKGKFGKVMEDAINNQDVTVGSFKQLEQDMATGTTNALDKAAESAGTASKKVGSTVLSKYREDVNYKKAYSASSDYMSGAKSGITSRTDELGTAAENAGTAVDKGYKRGAGVRSPSWKAKQTSEWFFIGAIQGAKGMEKEVVTEFEKIAAESSKAYTKKIISKKAFASARKTMVKNIVKTVTLTKAEKKKIKKQHTKDGKVNGEAYSKALKKELKKKKKEIKKEAKEIANTINDGFASIKETVGITKKSPADSLLNDFKEINSALNDYEKKMKKNFSKKEQKKFNNYQKAIAGYQKQIASYYNQLDGLYEKLDVANEKLEEAVALWQDYKDSVYDAFKSFASIASIDMNIEGVDDEAVAKATEKLEKVKKPLEDLQSSYDSINDTMSDYVNQIASSENTISNSEIELEKLRKEREELFSQSDYFNNAEAMSRVEDINKQMSGLTSVINKEKQTIGQLQDAYEQQSGLLEQRSEELKNAALAVSAAEEALKEAQETVVDKGTKGAAQFLEDMQGKLDLAKTFESQINQLTSMGLNSTAIQEIIGMGVEQGSAYASALLDGMTPDVINQMNAIQTQIEGIGDRLGITLADKFYGAGVKSAEGVVAGLTSEIANLENAIGRLVGAMENAFTKALKINSPSKVFEVLTDRIGEGIVLSLENSESDIKKEMENLTGILIGEYGDVSIDSMVTDALDVWIDKTEQFKEVLESLSEVQIDMIGETKLSADSNVLSIGSDVSPKDKAQGDTYIFNSPKQLSPEEQARAMKRAKRQQELGF